MGASENNSEEAAGILTDDQLCENDGHSGDDAFDEAFGLPRNYEYLDNAPDYYDPDFEPSAGSIVYIHSISGPTTTTSLYVVVAVDRVSVAAICLDTEENLRENMIPLPGQGEPNLFPRDGNYIMDASDMYGKLKNYFYTLNGGED